LAAAEARRGGARRAKSTKEFLAGFADRCLSKGRRVLADIGETGFTVDHVREKSSRTLIEAWLIASLFLMRVENPGIVWNRVSLRSARATRLVTFDIVPAIANRFVDPRERRGFAGFVLRFDAI